MSKPQVKPEDFMSILLEMTPSDIKSRTNISWHKVSVAFTLGWDTAISGVSNQGSMVKIIPKIFQLLNKENTQDALRILIYSAFSRDDETTERDGLKRILNGKNDDDLKRLFTTIAQTTAKQMLIPTQESDITPLVDSIISEHPELDSIRSLIEKRLREYTNGQTLKAELEKTGLLIPYLKMISDKREDNSAILKMLGAKDFEINTAVNEIREKANEKNLSTVKLESREYLLSSKMGIDLRSADQPLNFEKMIKGKENIADYQDLLDSNQSDSEPRELPEFIYNDDLSVKQDYLKLVLSARSKKLKMLFQLQGMFQISQQPPKNNKELLEQYQEVFKQALHLFELSKPSEQQVFLNGTLEKLYPDLDGKKQEAIRFLKIKRNRQQLILILKFFANVDPELKALLHSQVKNMLSSVLPQRGATDQDSTNKQNLEFIEKIIDEMSDEDITSDNRDWVGARTLIKKIIAAAKSDKPASTLLSGLMEISSELNPIQINKIKEIIKPLFPNEMAETIEISAEVLSIFTNQPLNQESIIKIISLLPRIITTVKSESEDSAQVQIIVDEIVNLAGPESNKSILLLRKIVTSQQITTLAPLLAELLSATGTTPVITEDKIKLLPDLITTLGAENAATIIKELLPKILAETRCNRAMVAIFPEVINKINDLAGAEPQETLNLLHGANKEFIKDCLAKHPDENELSNQAERLIEKIWKNSNPNGLKFELEIINYLINEGGFENLEKIAEIAKQSLGIELEPEFSNNFRQMPKHKTTYPGRHRQSRSARRTSRNNWTTLGALSALFNMIKSILGTKATMSLNKSPPRLHYKTDSACTLTVLEEAARVSKSHTGQEIATGEEESSHRTRNSHKRRRK